MPPIPFALAALSLLGDPAPIVRVPPTAPTPILLDGRLEPAEWEGAMRVPVSEGVYLLVKQWGGHVYVAVRTAGPTPQPMDLYLVPADQERYQLHASLQIGERRLTAADPDPAWHWGNHTDWIANEMKIDGRRQDRKVFSERLFPAEGTEYQIKRARFPGGTWRVRLEIGGVPGNERPATYPAGSKAEAPATWALWALDGKP